MSFFNKEKVTILVTDSGLGGLSVVADLTNRLRKTAVFKKAEVIFFNAQPHASVGYNSMKSTEQKVKVFNNALKAMEKNYKPDILLIACNTLSVLYDFTEFSEKTDITVIGIVDTGVKLIKERLDKEKNAQVIIFATETTVNQNQHKEKLMELGIQEAQIYTKACPRLPGRIENGSHSDTTISLINKYVKEACAKLAHDNRPVFVSYNCTHYGYVNDLFQKAFKKNGVEIKEFLDPNPIMVDFIFESKYQNRFPHSEVNVLVVSQTKLSEREVSSISHLLNPHSSQTAKALQDYLFKPQMFKWKSIVEIN